MLDLLNRERSSKDRKWIAAALGKVRWTAARLQPLRNIYTIESLVRSLNDSEPYIVRCIVIALGKLRHPKALDPLICALQHYNPDVRKHTAAALGKSKHPKAVSALISILKDNNSEVREQAILALESIGDLQAVPFLIEILYLPNHRLYARLMRWIRNIFWRKPKIFQLKHSSNSSVRCRAATALGELGDLRATKVLSRALSDPDDDVKERAIVSLGKIGGLKAVEVLVQALNRSNRGVKKEAVEALKKIGTRRTLIEIVKSSADLYDPDIHSLIRILMIRANVSVQYKPLVIYPMKGRRIHLPPS